MAEKTVAMSDNQEMEIRPEGTRTRERYVTPPVDIYEMPDGLVVTADVPGVTREQLDVRVESIIELPEVRRGVLPAPDRAAAARPERPHGLEVLLEDWSDERPRRRHGARPGPNHVARLRSWRSARARTSKSGWARRAGATT